MTGETALMWAAFYRRDQAVGLLLARGADVNARDSTLSTALMKAIKSNATAIVQMLLAKGADANVKDATGRTVQQMAEYSRNPVIKRLIKNATQKK